VKEPVWISKPFTLAIHEEMLLEFGGSGGVRDEGLVESALGKPLNLFTYGKPTLFDLAASYAVGVIRNHPFIDGNKRTGFMIAYTFLTRNGVTFNASEADAAAAVLSVAAGEMKEAEFAHWLEKNSTSRRSSLR
jgi:death-on-curing protein